MLVSEIFESVQGEGSLCGVPSVFIRTSGCNLRCRWCDTPYASWNPEGEDLDVPGIVRRVEAFSARHCVITGGEPMIARGIRDLAAELRSSGRHITIETAGTIAPDGIACDLASISPKLANSTPRSGECDEAWIARHESSRIRTGILREWVSHQDFQLKFVISGTADLDEAESLVAAVDPSIPPWKILLMPEGRTAAELDAAAPNLLAICRRRGYRFCDRLHIRLFGNQRGT